MRRSFGTAAGGSAAGLSSSMNRRSPRCITFRIFMTEATRQHCYASSDTIRSISLPRQPCPYRGRLSPRTAHSQQSWNYNVASCGQTGVWQHMQSHEGEGASVDIQFRRPLFQGTIDAWRRNPRCRSRDVDRPRSSLDRTRAMPISCTRQEALSDSVELCQLTKRSRPSHSIRDAGRVRGSISPTSSRVDSDLPKLQGPQVTTRLSRSVRPPRL